MIVMVRVSGRPPYSPTEDETAAEDLPVWQAEDLRADMYSVVGSLLQDSAFKEGSDD